MYCQNCGSELPEGAMFCPRCGTESTILPQQTDEEPKKTEAQPAWDRSQRPETLNKFFGLLDIAQAIWAAINVIGILVSLDSFVLTDWQLLEGVFRILGFEVVGCLVFVGILCFALKKYGRQNTPQDEKYIKSEQGIKDFGRLRTSVFIVAAIALVSLVIILWKYFGWR